MVRALVLADTHVTAGGKRRLPDAVLRAAAGADVVLHAGDLVETGVLEALAAHAPVHAVLGNNDVTLRDTLPQTCELVLGGVPVALVHDSGARAGRERRMQKRFPDAHVIVFGHSHAPCAEWTEHGQLLFNPGSATWKRTAPAHTYGVLELAGGAITRHEIVPI